MLTDAQQNVYRDGRSSKRLAEAVRKFEDLGVLQRVRARLEDDKKDSLHRCVKLTRVPTDTDWRDFFEVQYDCPMGLEVGQNCDTGTNLNASSQNSDEEDRLDDVEHGERPSVVRESATSLTIPISWNPDRLLVHMIHDALANSGTPGLSLLVGLETPFPLRC